MPLEPTVFVYHARTLLVDNTAGLTINGYFSCWKKRIVYYYRTASERSQISEPTGNDHTHLTSLQSIFNMDKLKELIIGKVYNILFLIIINNLEDDSICD